MEEVFLEAVELTKRYGNTIAVNGVSFTIRRGQTLGLIGANGAGKSTLMRLVSGVTQPDAGTLSLAGMERDRAEFGIAEASRLGIRVVYQELSLFSNLTVYENFFIEQAGELSGLGWRGKARKKAGAALNEVFPGCRLRPETIVGNLPIAQRQMVEIARAVSDPELRLLILDEPTSSLGSRETSQFLEYLAKLAKRGVATIFISHRLDEIVSLADSILILQNGAVKWRSENGGFNKEDLIRRMADMGDGDSLPVLRAVAPGGDAKAAASSGRISLRDFTSRRLHNINIDLEGGKIYGIAGLEGNGQKALLQALFSGNPGEATIQREGYVAYVSGDRKREGIFPLWNLLDNMRIGKLSRDFSLGKLDDRTDRASAGKWYDRLQVRAEGLDSRIGSLSGGNQQKLLIARAMLARADVILLDDPTRGVDVGTKQLLYDLFREAADEGKLIVWHSTEDDEFSVCDEVLVMRYGGIVKRLAKAEISKDAIIAASFAGEDAKARSGDADADAKWGRFGGVLLPFMTMVMVYVLSGIMTPGVFSMFGLELLIGGAIPLALAAVSQMYIIGFSHINMGVGAFMGMINVLGATWLQRNTTLGAGMILVACLLFAASGLLIHLRNIPAIVVTLGSSFIWTGISYTIQSHPGGLAPEWLVSLYNIRLPFLPTPVYWILLLILAAWLISGSRYGTVLKAAGNNPSALERSGWSMLKAIGIGYFVSAVFCALGGLALTAITTASDANSSASYTMLTVASVVMGGGELAGGKVSPAGAIFGAITLSLLGSLLGFMNVSSNYVTLVQGLILITVLGLRLLRRSNRNESA